MYYLIKCRGRVKKEEDRKVGQKGDKPSLHTWVTEGRIRQAVSAMRKGERASMYELLVLETWQRPLGAWRLRIGKTEDGTCTRCKVLETGEHVVFECERYDGIRYKGLRVKSNDSRIRHIRVTLNK